MFTPEQNKMLDADLLRSNVKTRDQSGRKLSFIEGWHAIAEANRIFGFGGWSSETVDIRCVSEKPREIGAAKTPGFGVTYVVKVKIEVHVGGGVVREGCGTGHGIDRDVGQAHESAIKEAETDARKRALMTFGNQFGLALYDKSQESVTDDTRGASRPQSAAGTAAAPPTETKAPQTSAPVSDPPKPVLTEHEKGLEAIKWGTIALDTLLAFDRAKDAKGFDAWYPKAKLTIAKIEQYDPKLHAQLKRAVDMCLETLCPVPMK